MVSTTHEANKHFIIANETSLSRFTTDRQRAAPHLRPRRGNGEFNREQSRQVNLQNEELLKTLCKRKQNAEEHLEAQATRQTTVKKWS